jgi:hypothetical protein
MSKTIDIKSVVLTPEITVEYTIERWEENIKYDSYPRLKVISIKNEKYAPLVILDNDYNSNCGIYDYSSFGYHFLSNGWRESDDIKRIANLVKRFNDFCTNILPLADEINYYPAELRAMILSEFLEYCELTHSWDLDKIQPFDFTAVHNLDLSHLTLSLKYTNELLHDKLVPEILKAIYSVNFTEEKVLAHIKKYPVSAKNKLKILIPVENEKGLIELVKSTKGRKLMQDFIFSTRDSSLIQKMIKEYKFNPDTIIDKAIKICDGVLISEIYDLLSKKKKDETNDTLIKLMPKLVGSNVTLELLQKIPDVRWSMYGPEPEITQYHSSEPIPKCLKSETLPEVTKFILDTVPNVIDSVWLKDYILAYSKKAKKVDKNFLANLAVFNEYIE